LTDSAGVVIAVYAISLLAFAIYANWPLAR
jgi:hypothetical protein